MFEVNVLIKVTDEQVRGLLCSAFEGGSNYWIDSCEYEFASGLQYQDFRQGGSQQPPEEYWHPLQLVPLVDGCAVLVKDNEDFTVHRVDRTSIANALRLMQSKYPRHFADMMEETDDATTGNVFLQLCCFGEMVFG